MLTYDADTSPTPVATTSRSTQFVRHRRSRETHRVLDGRVRRTRAAPVRRPSRVATAGTAPDVDIVDRVQGADLSRGAAWLSTDDTIDGVYRVDLRTGAVQPLGSIGRVDGEGEGIDAPRPATAISTYSAPTSTLPIRLIDLKVTRKR